MESVSRKQGVVWGGLLIFFGVLGLLQTVTDLGEWVWVSLLALAALAIFLVYLTDRTAWPLLIPVYVLSVIAGLIAFIELNVLQDEIIATYVLTAIAVPFLVVYLRDRSQQWALIPAYVLLAVGVMVGMIGLNILSDLLIPSYVMFAIAIPFAVVYALNRSQWWALIPAGVMGLIGFSFLIAGKATEYILPLALIIAGAVIIGRLYMRKEAAPPEGPVDQQDEAN